MMIDVLGDVVLGLLEVTGIVDDTTGAAGRRHSPRELAVGWLVSLAGGAALWRWGGSLLDRAGGWGVGAVLACGFVALYTLLASLGAVLGTVRGHRSRRQ